MNLIKSKYEILTPIDGESILKEIEIAARTCYKSEGKIEIGHRTPNGELYDLDAISARVLIAKLIKMGHEAMLEFGGNITVKFTCDRGVSHELVRHRIASFAQECVTGDTIIKSTSNKNITIKELYERQEHGTNYDRTHNKTLTLRSINENNEIVSNHFNAIFFKGNNVIFEVVTKLGYKIKCTNTHRFLTSTHKYEELRNLSIGSKVIVNGRPNLCTLSDNELIRLYNIVGLSPTEISEEFSIPYRTILTKLQTLNIFVKRKNDKDKDKYNKNHTADSYIKIKNTIQKQYNDGRVVWNKGLTEDNNVSVKRQANSLRLNHHNNGFGEDNSNWSGGLRGRDEARFKKENIFSCELCGSNIKLEVHHKDKDLNNNEDINLTKVCCSCHNLLHHGWHIGVKGIIDEIISITYIGVEDTYDIEMKEPYSNYIANGFIVHNSTRYCNYSKDDNITFIIPEWLDIKEHIYTEFDVNALAKDFDYPSVNVQWLTSMLKSEQYYNKLMNDYKWSPQQARSVLPNSLKTEINMSTNIRDWRHIFKLRVANAAHPQMRELMRPLLDEFKKRIPILFDDIEYK